MPAWKQGAWKCESWEPGSWEGWTCGGAQGGSCWVWIWYRR